MKRYNKVASSFLFSICFIPLFSLIQSCSSSEELTNPTKLIVTLVDSPADYEALNVDIKEISLKTSGSSENQGWITLDGFEPDVYNILEYTGGRELSLADMTFPPGKISQLKLMLGPKNTLIIQNYTSSLLAPASAADGLIMNVDINVNQGETHYLKLDFDASRSVVGLGNTGQLILKPVLRLFSETDTGSLTGKVLPDNASVLINIIANNKIIASSYATENVSTFLIPGINEGTYRVSMEISDNDKQKFFDNIVIANGKVTNMGTITLDN